MKLTLFALLVQNMQTTSQEKYMHPTYLNYVQMHSILIPYVVNSVACFHKNEPPKYLPILQRLPSHPGAQTQVKLFTPSTQVAALKHGELAQSFTSGKS